MTYQLKLLDDPQVSMTTDDWYTPPWIFEKLDLEFDLDVASPPDGVPWIPAKKYFSMVDDGLAQPWNGRVWLNPPYSNPLPWIIKFIDHGNGVALVPTSNGRWQNLLWDSHAEWVTLPAIRFHSPIKGPARSTLPSRCWLVGFGVHEQLERFGKVR